MNKTFQFSNSRCQSSFQTFYKEFNKAFLSLAGKAFADVINKDARVTDKTAKKPKIPSSHRLSAIGLKRPHHVPLWVTLIPRPSR